MHIPDGFLSGEACAIGTVAGAAGLAYCLKRVREEQRERDLPVAGLAAAFFLVGDAPVFPVTVGTQGHLLGGLLAVALLGPWLGAVTISVVCAIQALALGDGGITTLGLGVVNLALLPAFVGYPLLLVLRRALPNTPKGLAVAAGLCAWLCVVLSSVVFVVLMTNFAAPGAAAAEQGDRHLDGGRHVRADRDPGGRADRADPACAPRDPAGPRAGGEPLRRERAERSLAALRTAPEGGAS